MYIPTITEILSIAKERYKDNGILKTVGTTLVSFFIMFVLAIIPSSFMAVRYGQNAQFEDMDLTGMSIFFLLYFAIMLVISILYVGIFSYTINIVRQKQATIDDLFFGFKRSAISNALLPFGYFVAALPVVVLMLVSIFVSAKMGGNTPIHLACFVLVFLASVFYFITIFKFAFVYSISADQTNHKYNIVELFRISKKMTKGYKKKIFGLFAVLWLIAFCVMLVIQIVLVIGAYLIPDEATAIGLVFMSVVFIAYLAFIVFYGTYSMICFNVLYVAVNDKYFGVKPAQSVFQSDIDAEINAILKQNEQELFGNTDDR
jgi:MFS family permease